MLRGERDSTTAPTTRRPSRTGSATNTRTRVPRLSEARGGRGASEARSQSRLTGSPRSARDLLALGKGAAELLTGRGDHHAPEVGHADARLGDRLGVLPH